MAKYQPAHKKAQSKLNLAKPAVTMAVTASLALSPVLQTAAFAESGTDANDDVKAEQKQASKEEIAAAKADVEKAQKAYDEAKANVEKAEKAYDEAKATEAEAKAGNQEAQNALEDAKYAVYAAQAQLADAEKALGEAQKAYEDAMAEADKLGTEYNENQYEKKAEDARAAADAKKDEWDKAVEAQNEAQVAFENAKNLTSEEEAQARYDAATKKVDKLYQDWTDLDNAAAKAETAKQKAEDKKKKDLEAANDAQVALEAAKKLPSVEDAQAAVEAARDADNKASANFQELDNKALGAEELRDAKKKEWDAKLAEANKAQVAVSNRKANEAKFDDLMKKYNESDNKVIKDQKAVDDAEAMVKQVSNKLAENQAAYEAKQKTANQLQGEADQLQREADQLKAEADKLYEYANGGAILHGDVDAAYAKADAKAAEAKTKQGKANTQQAKADAAKRDAGYAAQAVQATQDRLYELKAECEAAHNTLTADTNEFNSVKDEKAAVSAQLDLANQFETLKGEADDLGREYNKLDNKALKARTAADEAWEAWQHGTLPKLEKANADLETAKNKPQIVKDAQTAFNKAMEDANKSGQAFNEADNAAHKAAQAAADAKAKLVAPMKEQEEANKALAEAKKKPQIVKAAEDALKAAAAEADKLGQKYNELDNEAHNAEVTLAAKQKAWFDALAKANAAQVAFNAAQQAQAAAAQAVKDAEDAAGAKSEEAKAAAAKLADAQSNCLNAYANHQLAMRAQANALAKLNAAKKVLGSLVLVEPTQPQATITPAKAPAKDEKKADEKKADKAALPTTGDNVAAQVTIIAGLGAAAIAAGATRRRFNA